MTRLTDNDQTFSRFVVYGKSDWKTLAIYLSSGGGDEDESDPASNFIYLWAFGWVFRISIPKLITPFKIKHIPDSWDAETIARLGRNYYHEVFPREYGFRTFDDSITLYLGTQTHDSDTTQSKYFSIPWKRWRFVRFSLYDLEGKHFWTRMERSRKPKSDPTKEIFAGWNDQMMMEEECPKRAFEFEDYDGKRITATTHIEEREWRFGDKWCKWLSLFRRPMIRRSLDLHFSEEVGPEKGSWKGGTVGHSVDMLPGELHKAAFRRYCDQEHDARGLKYRLRFIGAMPIESQP